MASSDANASSALASSEERLKILSELAHEYAYTATSTSDGFRLDWTTPNFERALKLQAGTCVTSEMWEQLVPAEDHAALAEWAQLLPTGMAGPLEHRIFDDKGNVFWVHHFARVTPMGDRQRIDGAALDITERKLAEQALQQSEERFRAIADHASDLLFEVNEHGRVVYVNQAIRKLLGWDPELLMGAQIFRGDTQGFVHNDDAALVHSRFKQGLQHEGIEDGGRNRVRHIDGTWRWFEFRARSYRTTDGLRRVVIGRDVTDQMREEEANREYAERLEREVRQRTDDLQIAYGQLRELQSRFVDAEKLGAADELAGSLAHAINNPLAVLLGWVQMELESPHPSREGLHRIHRVAQRIQSVVANTLALFREGRLRLDFTSVEQLLDDLSAELIGRAKANGVELRVSADTDLPPLLVDRALLTAALVSLAENGLDAMPDGGVLELEALHLRDIEVIQFRIGDSGPGIAPQLLERIFEPFFTTKAAGTGLGLTIANGVVRGHRGRIEVRPRASGGTLFLVSIPYAEMVRLKPAHAAG